MTLIFAGLRVGRGDGSFRAMNATPVSPDRRVIFTRRADYSPTALRTSVDEILSALGGAERLIGRNKKVILKPNLVGAAPRERNVLTDPALVGVVIEICQELGCTVRVCDSRVIGSVRNIAASNGILDVCAKHVVELLEMSVSRNRTVDGRTWGVAAELDWADVVINLPKLKGHSQLYYTGAVKNLFGCVSGKRKFMRHMVLGDRGNGFGSMLLDVAAIVAPTVTLLDGIGAHAGRGPMNGVPVQLGLLAGAVNPLALDMAVLDWLGGDRQRVSYVRAAENDARWKSFLEAELTWLGSPFEPKGFHFPVQAEMSPIRFSAFHAARSMVRRIRKRVMEKAALA